MKYPFRFTDTYIADIAEIVSVEILNGTGMTLLITFKTADENTIGFDTVEDCAQRFDDFCRACAEYAQYKQIKG